MTELEIRRARPAEAGTLTEIAHSAKRHWDYPEGWMEIWAPALTFKPGDVEAADTFAAVLKDELVGFYRLRVHQPGARLEDLWIKPLFMGRGVGRALFEHALARCRAMGVQVLTVESDPHAQGFYEKMGMRKIGQRPSDVDRQRSLPILEMDV